MLAPKASIIFGWLQTGHLTFGHYTMRDVSVEDLVRAGASGDRAKVINAATSRVLLHDRPQKPEEVGPSVPMSPQAEVSVARRPHMYTNL